MRYADDVQIDVLDVSEVDDRVLKSFCCGNESIDSFLQNDAKGSTAKTFVFVDTSANEIVAFTSFECSAIMYAVEDDNDVMLASERHGLISAIEIDYFAVNVKYQHLLYKEEPDAKQTLSCQIFRYVVQHLVDIASNVIGAEYIVLYSVPQAKSFYERNFFNAFDYEMIGSADPYLEGCKPMYYKI